MNTLWTLPTLIALVLITPSSSRGALSTGILTAANRQPCAIVRGNQPAINLQ